MDEGENGILKATLKKILNKMPGFKNVLKNVLFVFKPYGFVGSYIIFPIRHFFRLYIYCPKQYRRIENLKDAEKGKRCFIVSTGPSLSKEDIKLLKNEVTFGVNSIYKVFDELQWKPTYYVMTDPILFTNLRKREHIVVKDFSQKYSIVNSINREKSIDDEKIMYITNCWLDHVYHLGKSKRFKYNEKPYAGIYDYSSVTQECIYYAMYAGCNEIYLLGAENNYVGDQQHFVDVSGMDKLSYERALDIQNGNDYAYEYMKKIADSKGVKIYNATRGGRVETFPRVNLEDIL